MQSDQIEYRQTLLNLKPIKKFKIMSERCFQADGSFLSFLMEAVTTSCA